VSDQLLDVRDLAVTYHTGGESVRAVRGVDLTLDRGQSLGMAGESGSGKSTVALSLLRLLPASATITGTVRFRGEDLLEANWARIRAVRWAGASVVFQGAMSALNPVRSVGEQIREPILLHSKVGERAARERTATLLDSVGVSARRARSYPHELSGGQRQRVMIAMALACDPDLVVADEPTTALDVTVQAQILALLAQLRRTHGLSMLFISHDLAVVAQACNQPGDQIAVMQHGKIVERAATLDIFRSPQHPYTRKLLASAPTMTTDRTKPLASLAMRG
jgi:peptide/nickel transport system ATP-binding protein